MASPVCFEKVSQRWGQLPVPRAIAADLADGSYDAGATVDMQRSSQPWHHRTAALHRTAPLHNLSSLFPAGTRLAAVLVLVLMLALPSPGPWHWHWRSKAGGRD